jgi:hypothetical protein
VGEPSGSLSLGGELPLYLFTALPLEAEKKGQKEWWRRGRRETDAGQIAQQNQQLIFLLA